MFQIPHEPEKLGLWIIGFIVALFIVWVITGGPERARENRGLFIDEPAPLDSGEVYGPK